MRDYVLIYINGVRHEIGGSQARLSLSDYLRRQLGLVGTKIVCSEGDCGACSVLLGRPTDQGIHYQVVDSCMLFLFQLDCTHVVTIEGLATAGGLSAIQQSMIDCHGSQCGFCTPGFVMTMTGMAENGYATQADSFKYGLTGNLCRCTGYAAIIAAGTAAGQVERQRLSELFPPLPLLGEFGALAGDDLLLSDAAGRSVYCPCDLAAALAYLNDHPDAFVVAGATDIGVRVNKGMRLPSEILDLNRLDELTQIEVTDGRMVLGARAPWSAIETACRDLVPEFHRILNVFGSPQIRNVGTIGGNLINASPIADSLPFLYVMEAELELASHGSSRNVNITSFYQGYKKYDLRAGELLTKVVVPLPRTGELLGLYKVSRRRDLDISTFTAAIRLQLADSTISSVAIAFGAVGPVVLRARSTEAFLIGREFSETTMRAAGDYAVAEVTPISDVRGSAAYRRQLTQNVLVKFFMEYQPELAPA